MAADFAVRCSAVEAAVEASTQPELAFQRSAAEELVDIVRSRLGGATAGTTRAAPEDYGVHLRNLQKLSRVLDRAEAQILPCLERFGEKDQQQTGILSALLREAGWHQWTPAVLTWSTGYFFATPKLRIINLCAGEQEKLLRLPDVAHEFGHCLYRAEGLGWTRPLLRELTWWYGEAADPGQASFRDEVASHWTAAWLEEFTCDAIATVLTGAAYGKQHLMLAARRGLDPYSHTRSHPADDARAMLIVEVLRRMGLDEEADRIWARWQQLRGAYEQPVAGDLRRDLGEPAIKDPYFMSFYPTHSDGQPFINKVAELTVEGCGQLGVEHYRPGRPADSTVTGLLDAAWDWYENDPAAYGAAEPELVAELCARFVQTSHSS
jgi:hypothetical protein